MTPEALDHLRKAQEALSEARKIAAIELPNVAVRSAYFAVFHAAEALIVERTGKVAKTHSGLRSEFARLTHTMPGVDKSLLSFLGQAYKFKEASDYAVGVQPVLTPAAAQQAITTAERFVRHTIALLDAGSRPH